MRVTRRFHPALILGALLMAAACSDTMQPPVVASVGIVPTVPALLVGDTVTLEARALTANGAVVDAPPPAWASSNPAVAALTGSGHLSAVAPGRATIQATITGKTASIEVTVSARPLASLEVTPLGLTLITGESGRLAAIARDAAGDPIGGHVVSWRSGDAAIASVDSAGVVTAHRPGSVEITAETGGRSAVAAIRVLEVPVASIVVTPGAAVLHVGGTRQLTATLRDAAGNVLADRAVVWTVDAPSVAMVGATGVLAGTGPGYVTITASSGGRSGSVAATVTNGEADVMSHDLLYHRSMVGTVGELVILGTTGGQRPVVVNAGAVSRQPTASPDGSRIAFYVSMREPGTGRQIDDIYTVDRNGTNMKQLTTAAGFDDQPAWSPTGGRIAYRHIDPVTGQSAIRVMNSDGSGQVNLTPDLAASYSAGEPAWSPDGSRIAYSVMRFTTTGTTSGIWSMNAAGGDRQQHASSVNGFDSHPTWSPDGREIAFTRSYGDGPDITIVTLAGGATRRIELPGAQWSPAWSPDGRHIAFWQPVGFAGGTGIYTVRADGTNVRLHTLEPGWGGGYEPAWIRR